MQLDKQNGKHMKPVILTGFELSSNSGVGRFISEIGSQFELMGREVHYVAARSDERHMKNLGNRLTLTGEVDDSRYIGGHLKHSLECQRTIRSLSNNGAVTFRHEYAPVASNMLATHMTYMAWMDVYWRNRHTFPSKFRGYAERRASRLHHAIAEKRQMSSSSLKLVVALSERCRNDVKRLYNIPDEKIEVVYNGADLAEFRPAKTQAEVKRLRSELALPQEVPIFLFTGHNLVRKGMWQLLYGMAQAIKEQPNIHTVVLGEGNKSHFIELARVLGLENNVYFRGSASNWDVRRYMMASDVFILPSLYDPCPIVVFEAMAAGLPLIISDVVGPSEILTDGIHCLKMAAGTNPAEISMPMLRLASSLPERQSMGRENRRYSQQFTWQNTAEKIVEAAHERGI